MEVSHEGPCSHIDYLHHSFVYDKNLLGLSLQLLIPCLYTIKSFDLVMNLVINLVIRVGLTKSLAHATSSFN